MNLYGPAFFDDDALIAEIREYAAARKTIATNQVAVVAGEGRRMEFVGASGIRQLDGDLREMLREARDRGLLIGGCAGGAIAVEIM